MIGHSERERFLNPTSRLMHLNGRNMRAFLQRHRLIAFFVLAFALSWYPWIFALLRGQSTGPNPLGPLVAGIVITWIVAGKAGLAEFFKRVAGWRVGIKWYTIIFLVPIFLCLLAAVLTLIVMPHATMASLSVEKIREVPERFIFILLFIGLGEEPGWRGFALPNLQKRHSPLRASLILAPLWALWHLPLIGTEFPWPIAAPFVISVFGATFMLTWLFNRTGGSVLLPMLFHGTVNTVGAGLIFPLFAGGTLILLWWIYSFLWLGAGLVVLRREEKRRAELMPMSVVTAATALS